jgi:hypothetical protein
MDYDRQSGAEPRPDHVIIAPYRGPIIEQPKPYPTDHHLTPAPATPASHQEPRWIQQYREPLQRGWLPRWLKQRVGDDALLYAAARTLGRMFIALVLLVVGSLSGLAGYGGPVFTPSSSTFVDFNVGFDELRLVAAGGVGCVLLLALGGLLAGFRLRRNYWRSSNPQLAGRFSWLALGLATSLLVGATVGMFFILSYYMQHGS